jgi:integrase
MTNKLKQQEKKVEPKAKELISSCPACGSSHINLREKMSQDYTCYKCKSIFKTPVERPLERKNTHPWRQAEELKQEDIPTIEQIKEMALSVPDERIRALFVMGYLTAGRISEIIEIQKKDLKPEKVDGRDVLLIRMINRKNRKIKHKEIGIPIDTNLELIKILGTYLNTLTPLDLLFPFSTARARKLFKQHYNINPHYLRHVRVTHLVRDYELDPYSIEMIAGWSNLLPLEAYKHLKWKDATRKL